MAAPAAASGPCGRTRILFFSDSHGLTAFGDFMDNWLLTVPDSELHSFTIGGSSPQWWFRGTTTPRGYVFKSCDGQPLQARNNLTHRRVKTPFLPELLEVPEDHYDRQVVIVALGSNVPGRPAVHTEWTERMVRAITRRPENTCIWIAPPTMRKLSRGYSDQIYEAIRDGISAARVNAPADPAGPGGRCHLIDSRQFSEYPKGGDGVHYPFSSDGLVAAKRWTDGVIGEIQGILGPSLDKPRPRWRHRISPEL
jgi:hypothetical protein